MMKHVVSAALLSVCLAGCFHDPLPPISPHASGPERVAAYERLRPAAELQDLTVYANRYGATVNVSSSLVLADGTSIARPDDLLPVLDPETPASRAARRSAEARHRSIRWATGGLVVALVSGAYFVMHDASGHCAPENFNCVDPIFDGSQLVALSTMTAAGIVGGIGSLYFGHVAEREKRAAFATYDASLRQSLRLCVDGLQIVDCAMRADPPSTTAAR